MSNPNVTDVLKAIGCKISESFEYEWKCFPSSCGIVLTIGKGFLEAIFDEESGELRQVVAFNDLNSPTKAWIWIADGFIDAYKTECDSNGIEWNAFSPKWDDSMKAFMNECSFDEIIVAAQDVKNA